MTGGGPAPGCTCLQPGGTTCTWPCPVHPPNYVGAVVAPMQQWSGQFVPLTAPRLSDEDVERIADAVARKLGGFSRVIRTTRPEAVIGDRRKPRPTKEPPMTRGQVLPLTLAQIATRAKYLGGLAHAWDLDEHVRDPLPDCIDGYYLLAEHNGGKDPTAKDPFDRWSKEGHTFVNRTADCIGGAAWCGGFDRYQPDRFPLYDGWINTNSMIDDALGPEKCFELLHVPVPGCFMVAPTGAPAPFAGCGHIATVYAAPPPEQWDIGSADAWRHVLAVDVAARGVDRANMPTNGSVWYPARYTASNPHKFTIFCRSIMTP